jgi:transitional endoplasmic reticulum ATPase
LDQHIFVALPSKEERLDILKVLSRKSNVDDQTDFKKLANMTEYFTGADMQALLRKAGLCALKRRQVSPVQISEQDFINALSVLEASVSEAQQLRYSRFELTI